MLTKCELALYGGRPVMEGVNLPPWPDISEGEIEAVYELLRNNTLSIYDRSNIYEEFEDNFAGYHGVKYALSHNSGTSALHAAFFAADFGPGDEVLAPTYTFLATVMPIIQTGATPILCDLDPETLNIDPEDVVSRITKRTKGIVVTHIWGHPCEMERLQEVADANNLILIEDCSHAHGALYKGKKVGTFGHIACFSLEGHKPVYAGEGGVLITNNRDYYERAILLGHFGRRAKQEISIGKNRRYVDTGLGCKYRMHPLGAAIANIRLKKLDEQIEIRRENMEWFSNRIVDIAGIQPPSTKGYCTRGGWYGYKPKYRPKDLNGLDIHRYIDSLKAEGVPIKRPGSRPLHLLPIFKDLSYGLQLVGSNLRGYKPTRELSYERGDFPCAEHAYETLLSFPVLTAPARDYLEKCAQAMEKVGEYYHGYHE